MTIKNITLLKFLIYKGSEYFTTACKYFMAFVLIASGITKIISPLNTLNTVTSLFNIEENLAIFLITILPLIEIALAVLLITNKKQKLTLILINILFLFFFGVSIYGTALKLSDDCGCFGNIIKSNFGILMILRNALFLTITIWLYIKIIMKKAHK